MSLLTAPAPATTIPEVLERMAAIEAALPPEDGIACFNWMYRETTVAVQRAVQGGAFQDRPFLERLDVLFANRYFAALAAYLGDAQAAPRAWQALFEARGRGGVLRLQFAVAGMNAHINFDLGQAVVATLAERGLGPQAGSAQHQDYLRINDILASLEPQMKGPLSSPLIAEMDAALGRADDLTALWSIRRARDAAWASAEVLWALRDHPQATAAYVGSLDRLVGLAGRTLVTSLRASV